VLFSQRSIGTTARNDLARMAALASMAGEASQPDLPACLCRSPRRRGAVRRRLLARRVRRAAVLTPPCAPTQAWAQRRECRPPTRPGARPA
jgi:hypothetical protein